METLELNTIRKEITVAATQQTAFEVFVHKMHLWWPSSGHNDGCPMVSVSVSLEPKAGGRWIGYSNDGQERELGHVLIYDPYALFALDWQTNADFDFDPDLHSEVQVEFIPEGDQTRVKLTHRDLQVLGGPQNAKDISEGWDDVIGVYEQFLTNFHTSILVNVQPQAAEKAIADISGWWAKHFEGSASHLQDRFTVRFGETFVNFEIVDLIPGDTIAWEVKDCYLHWQTDKTEWTGTRVVWKLLSQNDGTEIFMTHIGLQPKVECYENCREGWTKHIHGSLRDLIQTGKGEPQ